MTRNTPRQTRNSRELRPIELTHELGNMNIRETDMNEMNVTVDDINVNVDVSANGSIGGSEASRPPQQLSPHTPQPVGAQPQNFRNPLFPPPNVPYPTMPPPMYMRPEILQARQIEWNNQNYPKLETLDPEAVIRFLLAFDEYEESLIMTLGLPNATLHRSLEFGILSELRKLGVETKDRDQIMAKLRAIQCEDNTARQESLIEKASEILFLNKGNIPASTRFFIRKLDNLQQGIQLDAFTDEMFCKAVIRNLPVPLTKGTVKATVKRLGWTKWRKMRAGLLQKASVLSDFHLKDYQLRTFDIPEEKEQIRRLQGKAPSERVQFGIKSNRTQPTGKDAYPTMTTKRPCFICKEYGHSYRECPEAGKTAPQILRKPTPQTTTYQRKQTANS